MGQAFGPFSEREIAWLKTREWAETADDILWRRSKLGLHMTAQEQDALRGFMADGGSRPELMRVGS
jgi:glycerol-3-phosphate dehydrogenase